MKAMRLLFIASLASAVSFASVKSNKRNRPAKGVWSRVLAEV